MNSTLDQKKRNPLATVDWWVVVIYLLLLAGGWISVCGASYDFNHTDLLSWDSRTGRQLVWMGCAVCLGFVLLMLEDRLYDTLAYLVYAVMLVVLLVTPFVATDIKGSYSWIKLGPLTIQPAEFAKCATALALAKLMNQYGFSLQNWKNFLVAALVVIVPMGLIVMQRETGSALVYLAFFLMFYREGMPGCFLFSGIAAVIYFVIGIRYGNVLLPGTETAVGEFCVLLLVWLFTAGMVRVYCPSPRPVLRGMLVYGGGAMLLALLVSMFLVPFDVAWVQLAVCIAVICCLAYRSLGKRAVKNLYVSLFTLGSLALFYSSDYALNNVFMPHQQNRIHVLLGMKQDPAGAGYNVNQSMIAIGSGGLKGKGFLNGTQTKLKYVPEQDTDFIFCTVGEEEGFIGAVVVLGLFLALILRLICLAERQTTTFGRVYGYSVMSIFLFHVFINIGMVLGLTPVIGIPLPFFSYGGSSLWGFTLLLFIFLRIDAGNKRTTN